MPVQYILINVVNNHILQFFSENEKHLEGKKYKFSKKSKLL